MQSLLELYYRKSVYLVEIIGELNPEKLAVLGHWLDDNLTTTQKEKLSELLIFAV